MTTDNKKSAASSKSAGPEPAEASPKKEPRMHVVPGRIPRKVVRTYFDPIQGCVIDMIEIPKMVKTNKGELVEIFIQRKVYCRDEAIQAKYAPTNAMVDIVEVDVDG